MPRTGGAPERANRTFARDDRAVNRRVVRLVDSEFVDAPEATSVIDSSLVGAGLRSERRSGNPNLSREESIHENQMKTARAGFIDFFKTIWKQPKPVEATLRNPPALVIAEGDLVALVWKRQLPEPSDTTKRYEAFSFDVMRVKDGKLVEHWDAAMKNARK